MKIYNITVNGTTYEVEVEETSGAVARDGASSAPAKAPVPVKAPAPTASPVPEAVQPKPSKSVQPSGGQTAVNAPMPGTILDVKVSVGDHVGNGDVLLILEAMKMENEIVSPVEGEVVSVTVNKGTSVNSGDVMLIIS